MFISKATEEEIKGYLDDIRSQGDNVVPYAMSIIRELKDNDVRRQVEEHIMESDNRPWVKKLLTRLIRVLSK